MIINRITSQVGHSDSFSTNPYFAEINKEQYVIKHIKNDESYISLFNELIGYKLAEKLGLKTPEYGHCYYKEDITRINPDLLIKDLEDNDIFTYTKLIDSALPLSNFGNLHEFTNTEVLRMIVFDCVICNSDRNSNNILMRPLGKQERKTVKVNFELIPIDYTHIFPDAVNWTFSLPYKNQYKEYPTAEEIIKNNYYVLLLEDRKYSSEVLTSEKDNFKKMIEDINLQKLIDEIPKEISCNFQQNELQLLTDFFTYRQNDFEYIFDEVKISLERRGLT